MPPIRDRTESFSGGDSSAGRPKRRDRGRVHHACYLCRKKKQKCDGETPCQFCLSKNAICVYVDRMPKPKRVHPEGYMEYLEHVLQVMRGAVVSDYLSREKHHPETLKRKAERVDGKLYLHHVIEALDQGESDPTAMQHEFDTFRKYLYSKGARKADAKGNLIEEVDEESEELSGSGAEEESVRSTPESAGLMDVPQLCHSNTSSPSVGTPSQANSTPGFSWSKLDTSIRQLPVDAMTDSFDSSTMPTQQDFESAWNVSPVFDLPQDQSISADRGYQTDFTFQMQSLSSPNSRGYQSPVPEFFQNMSPLYTQQLQSLQMESMPVLQDQRKPNSQAYPSQNRQAFQFASY